MMRFLLLFCVLFTVVIGAEEKGFSRSLPADDYRAAGLDKLSDEERARLDALVAAQVSSANTGVAAKSDRARPEIRRGQIAGNLTGWNAESVLVFVDGSRWRIVDKSSYRAAPVRKSPGVELFPLSDGTYIMTIKTVPRRARVRQVTE